MYHIHFNRRIALCILVLGIFFTNLNLYAAGTAYPNWNLANVGKQTRELTTDYNDIGAVIGAGSIFGDVANSTLIINGRTVTTDLDPATAYGNGSAYVVGGAGYIGNFTGNNTNIINSTIRGRDIIGGAAFLENVDSRLESVTANNNTVILRNSTTAQSTVPNGGNVIGGFAAYALSATDNNTVLIDNSTVNGDVYGAMVLYSPIEGIDYEGDTRLTPESHTTNNNTVSITNGSTVNGTAAAVFGSQSATGNKLIIDNATVDNATVVMENPDRYHMGDEENLLSDNVLIIRNGATVTTDVAAIDAFFTNTQNNTLLIDNTTNISGKVLTVFMNFNSREQNKFFGAVTNNHLIYQNITGATTLSELGTSLNLSGVSNANTLLVSNVSSGLTINRPTLMLESLDFTNLTSQHLISLKTLNNSAAQDINTQLNASYGFIYGGATYDYTLQENDETIVPVLDSEGNLPEEYTTAPSVTGNSNPGGSVIADGNTVTIQNSTVNSNIAGGIAGQIQEIHYATWEYQADDGTNPAKFYKIVVHKSGNTITTAKYDCGPSGTSCGSTPIESNSDSVTEFNETTISASNNTVILENATVDGTVYGGYAFGADLKSSNVQTGNNTVIIRGNTTLSAASTLYGGSSHWGQTTNKLVFDHVSDGAGGYITFSDKNQFQNFNPVWRVNADLDTRINFAFNGVRALVNTNNSIGEGSAVIITTKTDHDLTDVTQNTIPADLIDSSLGLAKEREGVYSFALTPVKYDASNIGWVLTSVKDKHNVELYGQVPLVGMVLAAQGVDMLSRTFGEAWDSEADHNVFLNGGYDHTRYITGSGFDINAGTAQAGLWTKLTSDWIGGLFAKYSAGNYKTFPLDAKGKASAYGGGVMSSFAYSETGHLEASAEVGYMHLDFDSSALASTLKTTGLYYGLMGGIVQGLSSNWDIFARIQYLHKNSDDMKDNLDQKIEYSAMNSLSLKAGTSYRFEEVEWQGLVPMVAASGLYEFAGDSKVNVQDTSNSSASLKGFSGRADVGLTFDNTHRGSLLPMISQLTVFGQAGNRRGFGAEINVSVSF